MRRAAAVPRRRITLAELERTFIVLAGADVAFAVLADPTRVPEYVSTVRLENTTAVDGDLDVDADVATRDGAPDAGFKADRGTRTISWGRPGSDYGGSMVVTPGGTTSCNVTIRLRVRDDADTEAVTRVLEQSVSSIRRVASGR